MCVYLATLFDYSVYPPVPLQSVSYEDGDVKFYTLFLPKTGKKLNKIYKDLEKIKNIIDDGNVVIDDFKNSIYAFNLEPNAEYDVYNLDIIEEHKNEKTKTILARRLNLMMNTKRKAWQKVNANAQVVYYYLEKRGIYNGSAQKRPIYSTNTFSGRSRTTGFNVQGAGEKSDLSLERYDLDLYVHFDWIAADLRVASIMSGDQDLYATFDKSDPYTEMARELGDGIDRDECKIEFLKSIYSLDIENPILELYPTFLQWMKDQIVAMAEKGELFSILSRSFAVDNNPRSVFSGIISGSVAHAMQASLIKIYKQFSDYILTETHDSITMICAREDVRAIINGVRDTMLHPFDGLLSENPSFPLKIYLGSKWKDWKIYKECRDE